MTAGRDVKGRYIKGHDLAKGKAGRKPVDVEERYFKAFCRAVSLPKWVQATQALLEKAINGDINAYKALAQYAMRLPTQRIIQDIEVSGVAMTLEQWQEMVDERREAVKELPDVVSNGST